MNSWLEIDEDVETGDILGAGAMGVVLRGRLLGQVCAVKMLHPRHMANPQISERFVREGTTMARLRSPYIPRVYRTGATECGQPYIAMELLDGSDLESQLTLGASEQDAVRWVRETCLALAVVHRAGIVHRDLKPANIFLARGGDGMRQVKLIDFGIAKLPKGLAGDAAATSTDLVFGSLPYMSPEQVRSSATVDTRADIWSVGVVLYELLTQELPFDGESSFAIMHTILHEPLPRLSELLTGVPLDLLRILKRCLEKDPGNRFSSAGEVADALSTFEARRAPPKPQSTPPQTHPISRPPILLNAGGASFATYTHESAVLVRHDADALEVDHGDRSASLPESKESEGG